MGRLDGKVAIITGGARGQGAIEGEIFVREGAVVVLTDIIGELGRAKAEQLGCDFLAHDVSNEAQWHEVVEVVLARYGRIDVLVNNAAIYMGKKLLDTPEKDFSRIMQVNSTGVFLGMQAVAPSMCAQSGGSIINVSSIAGLKSAAGAFAYGASKWAVRGMTKTAAVELARYHIRCNSIHPGMIETEMLDAVFEGNEAQRQRMLRTVPMRESAQPVDIANMALFLASEESRYVTGAEFVVDGGAMAV